VKPNDESWVSITVGLIHVVLAARNEVEANEPSTGLKKAVRAHAEARWSALATLKRGVKTALRGTGDHAALWHERANLLRQAANFFDELAISRPELVMKIDRNGSRKRQRFSARLSKHLHRLTGRWCHEEVATLTEIAFPEKKDVTIDMIRAARKKYCCPG
jgi:hypothetical protein